MTEADFVNHRLKAAKFDGPDKGENDIPAGIARPVCRPAHAGFLQKRDQCTIALLWSEQSFLDERRRLLANWASRQTPSLQS